MARYRCNTCGGVYSDVLPDGLRYYHRCPPLRRLVVERAGGRLETVDPIAVTPLDKVLEEIAVDRPETRDENVDRARPGSDAVLAEGKGRTELRT